MIRSHNLFRPLASSIRYSSKAIRARYSKALFKYYLGPTIETGELTVRTFGTVATTQNGIRKHTPDLLTASANMLKRMYFSWRVLTHFNTDVTFPGDFCRTLLDQRSIVFVCLLLSSLDWHPELVWRQLSHAPK